MLKRSAFILTLFVVFVSSCADVDSPLGVEKGLGEDSVVLVAPAVPVDTSELVVSPVDTLVRDFIIDSSYLSFLDYLPTANGEVVHHTYYSLSYMEAHEQSEWVFYMLTAEMVNGEEERTEDFREDPLVSTRSATLADYSGSGYDRGHLAPAKAMSLNGVSMSESFYLSNMSPQSASCNRGRWKSLETQVREWADVYDTLYVASGAIFTDPLGSIGTSGVTVPGAFYKVVLSTYPRLKMIAFIMPNEKMEEDVDYYTVSVDDVESSTGVDFFSVLPDAVELDLESSSDFAAW